MTIDWAARIYDIISQHFDETVSWQSNVEGDYERAQEEHREAGISKIRNILYMRGDVDG